MRIVSTNLLPPRCQLVDGALFFRSFTVKELGRLMTVRLAEPTVRAHEMGTHKRYFDLITTGRKTTEIRVNDSSRKKIKLGSLIRFRCQGDQMRTRVTKVARYVTFDEMFDHESVASVNPLATREEQLANIRQIYPPDREALGVVATGIELVFPHRGGPCGYTATTSLSPDPATAGYLTGPSRPGALRCRVASSGRRWCAGMARAGRRVW